MTSVCISNCINDARDPRVPVRATYVNLYKWPESDAEFVKSMASNARRGGGVLHGRHPRVVDSISCRQMYLRSYPFSREDDDRTAGDERDGNRSRMCFGFSGCATSDGDDGGPKKKKAGGGGGRRSRRSGGRKEKCVMLRRAKEVSCNALLRFFHRLLSCTASVDVAVQKD